MWLHTTMTYEYKFGGQGILKTIKLLKNQGGFRRFYLGIGPALIQGNWFLFELTNSKNNVKKCYTNRKVKCVSLKWLDPSVCPTGGRARIVMLLGRKTQARKNLRKWV
jgi:hypothetical protein